MKKQHRKEQVIIYQAKNGALEFKADVQKETIWLTQAQIAEVFDTTTSNINIHLKNVFKSAELSANSVIKDYLITASDGKTYKTKHYSLDAIISVGYRVNSVRATQFRIWSTKTLRSYIVDGYAINRTRIAKNYDAFLQAVQDVKALQHAF